MMAVQYLDNLSPDLDDNDLDDEDDFLDGIF